MTGSRSARGSLVLGGVAVVLAAVTYRAFDLDRFFVPKELVLHAVTLVLVLLTLRRVVTLDLRRIDLLLASYLVLSVASALLASDHWLSTRALAITLSSAGLFWSARATADAGARRAIVAAAAAAAVLGAATSLAQAYGVASDLFSLNRAPGGTFGNRNFMAHLAAIGTPALIFAVITARRSWTAALGAVGLAIIADALVLSRSRAAYLGLAAGAGLFALGLWRAHRRWSEPRAARRMRLLGLAAAAGILAAVLLPNTLEWKSDSPYLDTVAGVVNYREGSGRGRIVQYANTLRIAAAHPLLGVGPGNWGVVYPKFAGPNDPSIDLDDGMTSNPWPSSDWMAIVAERGVPALAAISLVLFGLLMGAWRRADHATNTGEYVEGLALATTLVVTVIVACFDAVLLLPAPAFIAWALFGALAAPSPVRRSVTLSPRGRRRLVLAVVVIGAASVLRSSGQLGAMALFTDAHSPVQFERAARLDPGSYKIQMRLAALFEERGECDHARESARSARDLYPNAPEPRRIIRACGNPPRAVR